MATVAPECQNNAYQQEIVRQHNNSQNSLTYDGQLITIGGRYSESKFLHSNVGAYWLDRQFQNDKNNNLVSNKKLQVLLKKLENDFMSDEYYESISFDEVKEKVAPLINRLALFLPEKLKLEPTYDNSIFYTLVKNDKKYFIEQFLDFENDEDDIEVSLVISEDDKNSRSIGGSISNIIKELRSAISKDTLNTILLPQNI